MDFKEAFVKYIQGQTVKCLTSKELGHVIAEGILLENDYALLSYGGGYAGEDINIQHIVNPEGEVIAKNVI